MVRPLKHGLDYFPLDVDFDQDDKVMMIEALHGHIGFSIVIKLLAKIYKEGYFYEWNNREQILFSKRVNVDINTVKQIVNDCVNEGLFHKLLFDEYHVLTSNGIQTRYLEAIKRRKQVVFLEKYFLIEDLENIVGTNKIDIFIEKSDSTRVNVNINPDSKGQNVNKSTQRKEKKNREKKNKEIKDLSPENSFSETQEKEEPKKVSKPKDPKYEILDLEIAEYYYSLILENKPDYKKPNLETWANDVRLMRQRDNRPIGKIKWMMEWVQKDSFWRSNILSISKLREQYDRLELRIKSEIEKNNQQTQREQQRQQHVPLAFQSIKDWVDEGE